MILLAVGASAAAAYLQGQDTNWDLRNYHYYAGYAFLHRPPHYDFAPAQVQSFFNPLVHVPSYLALSHLSGRAAALLFGAVQGLNLWLVFRIAMQVLREIPRPIRLAVSLSSAAAAFWGAAGLAELGTTLGDNLVSIPVLAALSLLLGALRGSEGEGNRSVLAAGILAGLAAGLKLTTMIYAAPLLAAFFAASVLGGRGLRKCVLLGAGMAAGFAVAYGHWGMSLWREYGNPVFPYLNDLFRSEYYPPENPVDIRFLPRNLSQKLFYPFYFATLNDWVSEERFRDPRMAACYVLALLVAVAAAVRFLAKVVRGERPGPADRGGEIPFFVFIFATGSYACWQAMFSIYRYAVLLEYVAPVFLGLSLLLLFRNGRAAGIAAIGLHAVLCAAVVPLSFGRRPFADGYLQVEAPALPGLGEAVILMAGTGAHSYLVPSFPRGTRFVRVESNMHAPGFNPQLEGKIRGILAGYGAGQTWTFVPQGEDYGDTAAAAAFYGVIPDESDCREIRARPQSPGRLCGSVKGLSAAQVEKRAAVLREPRFADPGDIRLRCESKEVSAGKDSMVFIVENLDARAIDLYYTIDGKKMPPVRNWRLRDGRASVLVGRDTTRGLYRIIGIRDSQAPGVNLWLRTDLSVRVH